MLMHPAPRLLRRIRKEARRKHNLIHLKGEINFRGNQVLYRGVRR
jgi:hypothetical protein